MSENLSNLLPLIIWTLILALLIPVSRIRIGYTFNPAAIFVLVWLAALWTNRLPELELYPPSTESLNLICLSILGFAIGFLLVVGKFKEHLYSTASFGSYLIANNRFSKVSLIASVILVLVVAKLALPGISNVLSDTESAAKVRAAVSEDGGISILKKAGGIWASKYGVILLEYMVFPGVYTLFGLNLARCIISGTKSSILILLLACLGMVLLDLLAFSRFQCLFIALTFLVGLFFGGHMWSAGQPRLKARQAGAFLWFIKFGILGCIALLMTISLLRMRGNMDMSKLSDDPLYYFSQPFTLFDMRSDVLVKDNFVYSVGGFCDLFNNFWTMILRHREIFFVRTMDLQTMVNIAPARQANAHYTWCLPFYQDLACRELSFCQLFMAW